MVESDLQALLVVRAHLVDSIFIDMDLVLVLEGPEEVEEYLSDPLDDFWALNPERKLPFDVLKVNVVPINLFLIKAKDLSVPFGDFPR